MSKRKWRRGPKILSLDELVRQEVVFWSDKPQSHGWFMSWQFRMAAQAIGKNGVIFYAMPAGVTTRFPDEEIIRAGLTGATVMWMMSSTHTKIHPVIRRFL